MHTVAEIVAAAARLGRAEVRELRREIDRLEKESGAILLRPKGFTCRLVRLDDTEFLDLRRRSLAVEEDLMFQIRFHLALHEKGEDLNFAQVYLALKDRCGESGRYFDDWKGSFSFPFALDVIKGDRVAGYLLEVRNTRDSLYFPLRKVVAPDDERLKDHRYHPPWAEECSRDEINRFFVYFYGYLGGWWEAIRERRHEPFLRTVASNCILFGCCNGTVFEEQYDSTEAYQAACRRYEEQIRQERAGRPQADPCVIREAGGDPPRRTDRTPGS